MIKLSIYSVLALFLSTILGFTFAQAQTPAGSGGGASANPGDVVPGEFIVKMKEQKFLAKGQQAKAFSHEKLSAKLSGKANFKKSISASLHHFQALKSAETQQIMNEIKNDPEVDYVEPNFYIRRSQDEQFAASEAAQSDPQPDQHIYSYDEVHEMSTTGSYVQSLANFGVSETWSVLADVDIRPIVAVIDTGVDVTHPIFVASSSIWANSREIPGNGLDDDGNGFTDDTYGWNFISRNPNAVDDQGHGTHIAGIIQGVTQDLFASSLAPSRIKIMSLKFMDSTGTGTTADAISAIYYAVNNGAKVINNSWGGPNYSQALHDSLTYAYARGIVIVSAAGNYGRNNDVSPMYPANLPIPSSISVAATNDYDNLASFSSFGSRTVDMAAPGVAIFSTYPGNSFRYLSGTSMAAPMVAGLAALLAREAPNLSGYQIKEKIVNSSDYIASLRDRTKSQSRMDSYTSVMNAKADISVQSYQPVYAAYPPAGAVDSSLTAQKSVGCGSVALLATSTGQKVSQTLQSLRFGQKELFLISILMALPIGIWLVTRLKLVTRNRRAHDRFVLNSKVRIKVGGRELVGNLSTIGVGGVSFDADAMIARGGQVALTITGPDGQEQIQVLGRVVWSDQAKSYGVQFAPMRETLVDRIRMWSTHLAKAA